MWLKVPEGITSWEFFDKLLTEANIVGTPGVGFGPSGEGYFRLTAFGTKENTEEFSCRIPYGKSFWFIQKREDYGKDIFSLHEMGNRKTGAISGVR